MAASDNFDRGDSATLGANWTLSTGSGSDLKIVTNVASNAAASICLTSYTAATPASADHFSQVTLTLIQGATDDGPGPAVRVLTGSVTGYFVQCNTTEIKLYRVVNGANFTTGSGGGSTHFATYSGDGAPAANTDVIRLEVSGTGATVSLTVKKNGATIITATDTDATRLVATGNWGLWSSGDGGADSLKLNDWSGDVLAGAGSTSASISASVSASASASVSPSPSSSQLVLMERTVFDYVD